MCAWVCVCVCVCTLNVYLHIFCINVYTWGHKSITSPTFFAQLSFALGGSYFFSATIYLDTTAYISVRMYVCIYIWGLTDIFVIKILCNTHIHTYVITCVCKNPWKFICEEVIIMYLTMGNQNAHFSDVFTNSSALFSVMLIQRNPLTQYYLLPAGIALLAFQYRYYVCGQPRHFLLFSFLLWNVVRACTRKQ